MKMKEKTEKILKFYANSDQTLTGSLFTLFKFDELSMSMRILWSVLTQVIFPE